MTVFLLIVSLSVTQAPRGQSPSRAAPRSDSLLAVMEARLEAEKDYRKDLLHTVYWALGGVGGLAVVLLGYGWFANFKVYERDKQALQEDLSGLVVRKTSELRGALDGLVKSAVTNEVAVVRAAVTSQVAEVQRDLAGLSVTVITMQAEAYKARGAHALVATMGIQWLEAALKAGSEYEMDNALKTLLSSFAEASCYLTTYEAGRLTALLEQLPADRGVLRDRVQAALKTVKVQ